VHDSVSFPPQEASQAEQTREIPQGPDRTMYDIQGDDSQTVLPDRLLYRRIRGQDINLPAVHPDDSTEPKNDLDNPAISRVAHNV
jgi:hypothetical protein